MSPHNNPDWQVIIPHDPRKSWHVEYTGLLLTIMQNNWSTQIYIGITAKFKLQMDKNLFNKDMWYIKIFVASCYNLRWQLRQQLSTFSLLTTLQHQVGFLH